MSWRTHRTRAIRCSSSSYLSGGASSPTQPPTPTYFHPYNDGQLASQPRLRSTQPRGQPGADEDRRLTNVDERGGRARRASRPAIVERRPCVCRLADRLHDAHAVVHNHVGQRSTYALGTVSVSWSHAAMHGSSRFDGLRMEQSRLPRQ